MYTFWPNISKSLLFQHVIYKMCEIVYELCLCSFLFDTEVFEDW